MRTTLFPLLAGLLILFSCSCATTCKDCTILYPARLIAEHPDSFYGTYVKLVGKLEYKTLQDQFPPFSKEDPLLCDSSGCIYLHDDTEDLRRFKGKRVKVLGYVKVSKFYFPYLEVDKIEVISEK